MQTENNSIENAVVNNSNDVVNEKKVIAENSKLAEKLLKKDAKKSFKKDSAIKNPTKKDESKKDAKKDLNILNLNQFSKQLSTMELKVKQKKDTLYIYPESFTENDKVGKKGKQFRSGLRNKIQTFSNNIFVYTQTKNIESLKKEIAMFTKFYKENYRVNDFTPESISQADSEKSNFKNVSLMMQIINATKK